MACWLTSWYMLCASHMIIENEQNFIEKEQEFKTDIFKFLVH